MKFFKYWLPVIAWMGIIFYLSHQPASSSSELSTGLTMLITNTFQSMFSFIDINISSIHIVVRKLAHFGAYLILAYLVMRALTHYLVLNLKMIGIALFICVVYAISDEVHQLFIDGRSGEVRDVLIDSIGAIVGIIVYILRMKLLYRE